MIVEMNCCNLKICTVKNCGKYDTLYKAHCTVHFFKKLLNFIFNVW